MSETIHFGLLGCGMIGPLHADAIASLPDAEVSAVVDVVLERAETLAARCGARAYTDLDTMLASENIEVVIIGLPSGMHGEYACRAMRAGCHVIVEKPMEIRREALDEMLRVQQETGRKLAVISQRRFDPGVQQVRKLIDEGALGRLVVANAVVPWWRSQGYYDSGAWRGTWSLDGGGILMNQAIHCIDLFQWMMGPVKSLTAYTDTLVHQMETEDVAVAILRFASGALGTISATTGAYPGLAMRLELFGNQGSVVLTDGELDYLHLARDEQEAPGAYGLKEKIGQVPRTASAASDPAALAARSHALQIADMLQAIREDGTPLVDGQAGRHPVEIILGIYESSRTGREVML